MQVKCSSIALTRSYIHPWNDLDLKWEDVVIILCLLHQIIPLAHYYVIAGKVYQAPDLGNVVNSRLANCANYLQQAFSETHSYAKYQSAKGYYWEFKDKESQALEVAKEEKLKGEHLKRKTKKKEEPSSVFQRQKVDRLLDDLTKKFPLKLMNPPASSASTALAENFNTVANAEGNAQVLADGLFHSS